MVDDSARRGLTDTELSGHWNHHLASRNHSQHEALPKVGTEGWWHDDALARLWPCPVVPPCHLLGLALPIGEMTCARQ